MSYDAASVPVVSRPAAQDRARLVRRAKALSWASLGWMTIEGAVGVIAGVVAGSVSLTGFGLDSVIEGAASVIVIWRFTGSRALSDAAERRAQKLVALSFFVLAPYIAVDAAVTLANASHPDTSWVGVVLSLSSIVVMPRLGRAKAQLGAQLGSAATAGEGEQNMLCAYMAAGVLVGLLANTWIGWWWLDPIIALGIAGLAVREGREAWRGEGCACASPVVGRTDDCC
jgi:divalent metal cation (Fe/Co/Zn/Cd) transporter